MVAQERNEMFTEYEKTKDIQPFFRNKNHDGTDKNEDYCALDAAMERAIAAGQQPPFIIHLSCSCSKCSPRY